jgi:hypothetical protein
LRGLEVKEDTYAYLKLVRVDGTEIELLDSGSDTGFNKEYSNFIIQSVTEQFMERHQVVETFGDTYLFLFGDAPRFIQVSAMVINSHDFNWKSEFMANYRKYLRGTKALEMGARTYLHYDTSIVEGYILNASVSETSDSPMLIPIQFQMFVTNSEDISVSGDSPGDFPIRASALFPEGISPKSVWSQQEVDRVVLNSARVDSGFAEGFNRTAPLRSKISNNADEFTTPVQPTQSDLDNYRSNAAQKTISDQEKEVSDLANAFGDAMSSYGADKTTAYSPETADRLGYGPTFLPGGVGVGTAGGGQPSSVATFGAANPPSNINGGFAGTKTGSSRGVNAFQTSYSGVGASTRAGASAGDKLGSGAFFNSSLSFSSNLSLSGSGVAQTSESISNSGSSFKDITSRSGSRSSAAYAKASQQGSSYADQLKRSTAIAGGYSNANSQLGFQGANNFVGASSAGNSGSGASIDVGGDITAFSFSSVSGELTNVSLPAKDALNKEGRSWSWSADQSWPSGG